ncbi:hypothetical protein AB0758_45700 [Tolypothrix bouteillei VB521301_2]|uniref:Uncharacterized protein n=1 Tax=Tolypothrix bouteillei VB521301 TaxID=1479485 RepID=A0A0C1N202_9CYAN
MIEQKCQLKVDGKIEAIAYIEFMQTLCRAKETSAISSDRVFYPQLPVIPVFIRFWYRGLDSALAYPMKIG